MGFSGFLFVSWRVVEFLTVVPIIGMLSYFVDGFVKSNLLTPTYILLLFITSVLAGVWILGTIFLYTRARHAGGFVALVDLAFVATLIAAVYELRGITDADCTNFARDTGFWMSLGPYGYVGANVGNPLSLRINRTCAMLKASFALGIMLTIFFFITFLLALLVRRNHRKDDEVVVKRETHVTRHNHRRSSREYAASPRRSHHSQRSSRRYYV